MSSPRWPRASERRRGSRGVSGSLAPSRGVRPDQVMLFIIWYAWGRNPLVRLPAPGLGDHPRRARVYAFVMKTPEEINDRARAATGFYIDW
jgi:hypothetical protein